MAIIETLKDNKLIGGTDNTEVYPITSTQAVYCQDPSGAVPVGRKPKLEDRLKDIEAHLDSAVDFEGVLRGSYKVVNVVQDMTISEAPAEGTEIDVIYTNNTAHEVILTIVASQHVKTPLAQDIILIVLPGGYGEVNYSNISGTIYVRGV